MRMETLESKFDQLEINISSQLSIIKETLFLINAQNAQTVCNGRFSERRKSVDLGILTLEGAQINKSETLQKENDNPSLIVPNVCTPDFSGEEESSDHESSGGHIVNADVNDCEMGIEMSNESEPLLVANINSWVFELYLKNVILCYIILPHIFWNSQKCFS